MRNTVVSAAPTSTTNITGFFISVTGFSFTNESLQRAPENLRIEQRPGPRQLLREAASSNLRPRRGVVNVVGIGHLQSWKHRKRTASPVHQEMLHDRAQRSAGKNVSAPTMITVPPAGRRTAGRASETCRWWPAPSSCRQAAGDRQQRNDEQEPADQHRQAERQVVPGRIGVEPGEGAAVVPVALE